MARPRIEIDEKNFESLCGLQCTLGEIADFFSCSEDTIERWCKRKYNLSFAEAFKKHSGKGRISLRRAQFRLAEKNASMAIWLGKQYLGQSDNAWSTRFENNADNMTSIVEMLRSPQPNRDIEDFEAVENE